MEDLIKQLSEAEEDSPVFDRLMLKVGIFVNSSSWDSLQPHDFADTAENEAF
jgi:hypothetical protein